MIQRRSIVTVLSLAALTVAATLAGCEGLIRVAEVILAPGPGGTFPGPGPGPGSGSPPPGGVPSDPGGGGSPPSSSLPPGSAIGPSLAQLDGMASAMLTRSAAGSGLRGSIVDDARRSGGVAAIGYRGNDAIIYVHPQIRQSWSTNTWAFILGHELSHALLQHRGGPEDEWEADEHGAAMAHAIGYEVRDYIRFVCSEQPNSCSPSHGCFHDRMRRLEDQFRVSACESDGLHVGHAMAPGISALAPPSADWTGPCILELPE